MSAEGQRPAPPPAQAAQALERRCNEHLATLAQRDRHIAVLSRQIKRCGKAIGQSDPDQVASAVEAFVRKHTPATQVSA